MIINKKMERSTEQKRAILAYLTKTRSHPTARDIYCHVRQSLPQISRATVYRNIDIFVRKGMLREIITDGERRFDATVTDHAHFCCESCEKISDIGKITVQETDLAAIEYNGVVRSYAVYVHGLCKACAHRSQR
jgi:Fe2+ or Zn2+ uptake regulation protein